MGEYIRNKKTGEEVKIGVMDNCFFSHQQIESWAKDPDWEGWYANKPEERTLEDYLEDPSSLYEQIEGLHHKEFALLTTLSEEDRVLTHHPVYVYKKGKRGSAYQYTVECQQKGQKRIYVRIVGERYDEKGDGQTIFACDCCDAMLSLSKDELDQMLKEVDNPTREYLTPLLKARRE